VIPLVRYQEVLWAVPVEVGGVEALFLLDTGAGLTTLDRALADRLGLRAEGRFAGTRMSGEVVEIGLAHDVGIGLGGRRIGHETVGLFDLQGLLPEGWPSIGGAIGLPTFESLPCRIDFASRRLDLEPDGPKVGEIVVREAREGPSRDLFVEVRAPDRSLWLELDTANTGPVILSPAAAEAFGWADAPAEADLDVVGIGPTRTPIVVKEVVHDGNLGAPFFENRPLTLDLPAGRAFVGGTV